MTRPHLARTRLTAASVLLLLLATPLAACSGTPDEPAPASATASSTPPAGDFPRVLALPDGGELTIATEPHRIAALSYEAAELVAALGLADRLVLVPEAIHNPAMTNHADTLAAVPNSVPSELDVDPEAVIALAPDLVVLSDRHGTDTGSGPILAAAGIPALVLPKSWSDPAALAASVELVGAAVGADEAATEIAGLLHSGLVPHEAAPGGEEPRVLVLSNQAARPFITAGDAFPLHLLALAGGSDVSPELGVPRTGPVSVEQVLQADPDGIVLIDMNGTGDRFFAELLENPAVAALPAVAEGRILRVPGRQVQAHGLTETVAGLALIADWVDGL